MTVAEMAKRAKLMTFQIAKASCEQKNKALFALVENLKKSKDKILEANQMDIAAGKVNGLSEPLLERLSLKLEGVIEDVKQVIALPDPIEEVFDKKTLPNGLQMAKHRIPIGVLGVIYESRPNVTIDITTLALKSGNCALLRGGSETLHTNKVLIGLIQQSLESAGLPKDAIQLITNPDRSQVKEMLQLYESIDLIIPRGSETLQDFCRKNSMIPVITGGVGICHLYVDETADLTRSLQVILNAKIQRPTVCNSLDTLLVHESIASTFIPKVIELLGQSGVTFRLDPKALNFAPSGKLAEEGDFDKEWLCLILGIKVVKNLKEAIEHIHLHSTRHSDGILTETPENAESFIREIDSSAVYVNASTRFTDGAQFGLGGEVAVSTQKLHARGPMGLEALTSYKWVLKGDYLIRR